MPREIDCPDCDGKGEYYQYHPDCYQCPVYQDCEKPDGEFCYIPSTCDSCQGTGKITVYTEEEFQEAIKAEREECLQDFVKKLSTGYTIKECVEAIRAK